jgi:DHA3 family macrolide efflux protein-like MFS transporter
MKREKTWKHDTILFLVSQNISLFGSMLVQYAIMWHITLVTQSGVMMTVSILCGFIPTLIISPFAGVWADRFDRKRLIVFADALIALVTLGMAILFYLGQDAIWQLFAVLLVRSFGTGIQTPAVSALLPQIVPQEKLTRVNGLNGSVQSLVTIVTPMLSGALLTLRPLESIFSIDVVTAAIAIVILSFFLKIPIHEKAKEHQEFSYFSDMRDGIRYINNHGFIKVLFAFCAAFFVFVTPLAFLTPLQVTRSFGSDVWRLTAIEVAFSGGMMLGGLLIASWGGFANKLHTMAVSTIITGLATLALGIIPIFWIYLAFMAVIGISMPLFNTPFTVLLQQKVEEGYLGRVFGVFTMISSSVMPLSMLVFGPLSDAIEIEWLLLVTSVLMTILGWAMLGNKKLVAAGAPDIVEAPTEVQS